MEDNINFDLSYLNERIDSLKNKETTDSETTEEKAKRILILLHKIEEEMSKVETVLNKLWDYAYRRDQRKMMSQASEKIKTIKKLKAQLQTARLNLNLYYISK